MGAALMARDCDYSLKPHIEVKEYDTISMMIFSTRAIQMNLIFEILPVDSQYSLLALTNTVSAHHLDVVFMKSRCEFVLLKSTKIYFARVIPCEPEALLIGALGGLFYFTSICVECSCQNLCGSIFQPTVTILSTVLDWFL
ncbi:hypothetical protein FRACYDRAFT_257988 [Fragilariopsis cylindrus CCMP1102]|uniref:Uncharacterized protein n=1 Tax=Fragilariopsis cylindrus CCMP1102 TaxID=635003 RepID=A0A1E7EIU5_9STRA|nr:hypothetical protein FRACYDRAFT_257988 [Fragilariopsis cylindrus CCMP1102]|eukprot:OEU05818.1 hypothetical protein FRACYDRAFT_257988 [Fragilariopsis cylindrus CCMP1102]